jgi:hypothetical protein
LLSSSTSGSSLDDIKSGGIQDLEDGLAASRPALVDCLAAAVAAGIEAPVARLLV